jgi:hypothetical protein
MVGTWEDTLPNGGEVKHLDGGGGWRREWKVTRVRDMRRQSGGGTRCRHRER